ncbi:MAG: hypothetical protein ACFKPT_13880 [Gloeotrichia echinulata GP01]
MTIDVSTPAIWYPGQSQLEFEEEVNLMMERSRLTTDLLNGNIEPDAFLDMLNDQGFDIFDLAENHWIL